MDCDNTEFKIIIIVYNDGFDHLLSQQDLSNADMLENNGNTTNLFFLKETTLFFYFTTLNLFSSNKLQNINFLSNFFHCI